MRLSAIELQRICQKRDNKKQAADEVGETNQSDASQNILERSTGQLLSMDIIETLMRMTVFRCAEASLCMSLFDAVRVVILARLEPLKCITATPDTVV